MAGAVQPNVETMDNINKPVDLPSNHSPTSQDSQSGTIGKKSSGHIETGPRAVDLPTKQAPSHLDGQASKIGQKLGQKEEGGKGGGGGSGANKEDGKGLGKEGGNITEEGFKAGDILKTLSDSFAKMSDSEKKSQIKKTNGIFQMNVVQGSAGKEAVWTIDLKKDGDVVKGTKGKPDVTINLDDSTFVGLADGTLNAQKMFMQGKIKVKGNVMLATKLGGVLQGAKAKL